MYSFVQTIFLVNIKKKCMRNEQKHCHLFEQAVELSLTPIQTFVANHYLPSLEGKVIQNVTSANKFKCKYLNIRANIFDCFGKNPLLDFLLLNQRFIGYISPRF